MKKVLITTANLRKGNGIASCIMNYYDGLLANGYTVDFLNQKKVESSLMDYAISRGSKVIELPFLGKNHWKANKNFIFETIKKNNYDIVHNNLTGLDGVEVLMSAKKVGTISIHHSHNPKETSSLKARVRSMIFDPMCAQLSNEHFACSRAAGDSVFGKDKYLLVTNAIPANKFIFDEVFRKEFREKYGINDCFVIGTVCRHAEQKNPYFIVDILEQALKIDPKVKLLWLGSGPLSDSISEYVEKKGLSKDVLLLGAVENANVLYSVMDTFILPSFFEGLGMVLIEAQASGLQCVASDKVPLDTQVSPNIEYYSLNNDAKMWANKILSYRDKSKMRGDCTQYLRDRGYDITIERDKLANYYDEFIMRKEQ